MTASSQRGFSLIELVMVIVVLAVGAAALLQQFTQVAVSLNINEEIQTSAQLAQEAAEQALMDRRNLGYASLTAGTTTENLTGNYNGYTRVITITDTDQSTSAACPGGASCKDVQVQVSGGNGSATLELTVVDY